MGHESFALTAAAAEIYEIQKVTAIFRPLAQATLDAVGVDAHERVIDVACGTGIVSRVLAQQCIDLARIVAVDLNTAMLDQARSLDADLAGQVEWYQADVASLPFADAQFSTAFCQQGLQYFPGKQQALAEIRRVLQPGGRLVLSVWSGASPLFVAIADALAACVNEEVAQHSLTPFAFNDQQLIESLIAAAGYRELSVSRISVDRRVGPAAQSIPREIAGNPIAVEMADVAPEVMHAIVAAVARDLDAYRDAEGFLVPQESYLFVARS